MLTLCWVIAHSEDEVKKIIMYHVFTPPNVPSVLYSSVVAADVGKSIESVNGFNSKITSRNGDIFIGKAKIIEVDQLTSNGVGECQCSEPV